jgi:hypothetical protein
MTTQDVTGDRKRCARCRQQLHIREFRPVQHLRSGLDSWCRSCHRAATREWRAGQTGSAPPRRTRRGALWVAQTSQDARKYVP